AVVHDRVTDHTDVDYVLSGFAGLVQERSRQRVECRPPRLGHLGRTPVVHHGVRDTAHEVLPEPDLRVHGAGGCQHVPGGQVEEMACQGGGADVEGESQEAVVEAGPDGDHVTARVDRHRHRPPPLDEITVEVSCHVVVELQSSQPPHLVQG